MKLYILAALTALFTIIPVANACHGIGCTDNTPPTHCRAFGCPNPPAPARCRGFGCVEASRHQPTANQVTTIGKVFDNGANSDEVLSMAADSAEAQAELECGTTDITRVSDWTIWTSINHTYVKATFQCLP